MAIIVLKTSLFVTIQRGQRCRRAINRHTLEQLQSTQWRPELINRLGYEKWEASGRTSLLQRAQQKLQKILQEHQPVPIPAEKARIIRKRVDQFRE